MREYQELLKEKTKGDQSAFKRLYYTRTGKRLQKLNKNIITKQSWSNHFFNRVRDSSLEVSSPNVSAKCFTCIISFNPRIFSFNVELLHSFYQEGN